MVNVILHLQRDITSHSLRWIQSKDSNKCWQGCGVIRTLRHCWWQCKVVQSLWKIV